MADSGPEDTTDGPDGDDVADGTDARVADAAAGDGPATDETMTTGGAGGANLRIIPPDGDSQPGVRTRRTAPRRRPATPPPDAPTQEPAAAPSADRGDRPPLRSLHALDLPLPAMAPGTGAGRPTGDESSDAGADDSPIIRVDSGDRPAASVDEDTETRRRRRRDRSARRSDAATEEPVTPAPAEDLTEDSGAFDYDAVTEYEDRDASPDGDESDDWDDDSTYAARGDSTHAARGDEPDDDDHDDFDDVDGDAVALDEDVADDDAEVEDEVVAVVTDRPGPALSKLRRGGDGKAPAADGGPAGGASRPNPYVKVGVGLGFAAVAVAILVLGGRPGFAFMVATFVVWVSIEYQMALGEAVRLTELEGVPVAVGARDEQRRGVTAPVATLSPFEPASLVAIVAALAMVGFGYLFGAEAAGLVAAVAFVAAALWGLGASEKTSVLNAAMSLTSIAHIAVLGTFAMLTLRMQHGFALLIVVVLLTVVSDVAAYGFGSWIGRRKFFPSVSPNKSLEGFVASAVVTVLVAAIIVALRPVLYEDVTNLTWAVGLVLGVVVAVFATLGDLAESLIKRSLGIKDMASLLPGHGGMFDRFDAALFVFPAAYLVLWLTGAGSPT